MKVLFYVILLFPLLSLAPPPPGGSGSTLRSSTSLPLGSASDGTSPPASPLRAQNFEGTGYDNGETWIEGGTLGIVDEDYTGVVLKGSQSLRLQSVNNDTVYSYNTFTGISEVWGFFRMKWVTKTSGTTFHQLRNNVSVVLLELKVNSGASATVTLTSGGQTATTTSTMAVGTEYYVWYHYLKGSGANATAEVWFSNTSVKPGDGTAGHAKVTNSNSTTDAAEVALYIENVSATSNEAIFDRFYLDDAAIGNNP